MAQPHQYLFYELMWRVHVSGRPYPVPWWVRQYFRSWVEPYDQGLFDSKQAAFASNAYYRYWNMVGVKDHQQECLIGQAGEIEPVYDKYTLSFFMFNPDNRTFFFPQEENSNLHQNLEKSYLPIFYTIYKPDGTISVTEKVLATVAGSRERSIVLARFSVNTNGATSSQRLWLCLAVSSTGPTGFERNDRAGRISADRRLSFIRYNSTDRKVEVNTSWGPIFDSAPAHFGLYGNDQSTHDPEHYLLNNPYADLLNNGSLNGLTEAGDLVAGLCTGVFAWPVVMDSTGENFRLNVILPVDDYRGQDDLLELRAADPDTLEINNRGFWEQKLEQSGLQIILPNNITSYSDLYRICRANLLILADKGEIHPGPTIYDSFWVRDSSVEGIACALAGDKSLTSEQFGTHYLTQFHTRNESWGPVSLKGFFGGEHEKNDLEWDSNGQVLWAFGKFDRISGEQDAFGKRVFNPYVIEGARWIRDNRSRYGLLHSGWSAEHLGDKNKPHYWDDLWGLAGLYEAAKLAERINAPEVSELWAIYNDLRFATVNSIRWVLQEQRNRGFWETFIPTGPGDVGRLDSTIVGTVAYFHPCRLYMNQKLGRDIDLAARYTLDTIWSKFVRDGGFEHNSAWNAFGPYLTLQLAHAFLYLGEIDKMESLLSWSVFNAAFAKDNSNLANIKQIVLGGWNEQHCYPVASNFTRVPDHPWYMGDIPHGWACAEFMMLIRDILFLKPMKMTIRIFTLRQVFCLNGWLMVIPLQ